MHIKLVMNFFYCIHFTMFFRMDSAQIREEEIFRNHYSKLQATLIDVDSLLPYFVEHNIITIGHLDQMASLTALAKVSKLLSHIRIWSIESW